MHINYKQYEKQRGISLVELVIFIAILAVALTGITVIYLNATRYSADPMVRIRSIELAQSTLEEILLKNYDNNSPVGGGCVHFAANTRCPVGTPPNPTAATETLGLGAEEGTTNRSLFNDVDDYHNLSYCGTGGTADAACSGGCMALVDESGNNIAAQYAGYAVCIRVSFAGNELNNVTPGTGTNVLANDAKRIDVIVTDPLNSKISLSAYRLNY